MLNSDQTKSKKAT